MARRIGKRKTQLEIEATLREFRESGLAQAEFARRRKLSLSTLRYWLKKSETSGRSTVPKLRRVEIVGSVFGGATVTLAHPSGVRVEIPSGVTGRRITEILAAVGDACSR